MVINAVNRFELNFASVPGALSRQGCPAQSSLNDRVSAAIPASKYVKPKAKITVPCLSEIETVRARKIFTSPVIRSWLPCCLFRIFAAVLPAGHVQWRGPDLRGVGAWLLHQ
ncbi:hypothetical protein AFLA_001529 [Aspergillus flavus NRRL3357]|nr:hypothetical protein AFLA_001529 [Aspergillus flavus NRRL3357]